MILILDIDDVLLDWTKNFDWYVRKYHNYSGLNLSHNPKRLWDALEISKEKLYEIMQQHAEDESFKTIEYFKDAELIKTIDKSRFEKIYALTSCGTSEIIKNYREQNIKLRFDDLIDEIIFLPFLAPKIEILSSFKGKDIIILDDNINDILFARELGFVGYAYAAPFHPIIEGTVENMQEFMKEIENV